MRIDYKEREWKARLFIDDALGDHIKNQIDIIFESLSKVIGEVSIEWVKNADTYHGCKHPEKQWCGAIVGEAVRVKIGTRWIFTGIDEWDAKTKFIAKMIGKRPPYFPFTADGEIKSGR